MENLQMADFLNYRFLSALKYSPDAAHAAFVVSQGNLEENRYRSCLYVWERKGEKVRQLTYQGDSRTFVWLDNETLLFPARRGKADAESEKNATTFYRIRIDGGEAEPYFTVPVAVTDVMPLETGVFALVGKYVPRPVGTNGYEIFDEIPFWTNGEGVTNKSRRRLYRYAVSNDTLVPVTDEYTNVTDCRAGQNGVLFSAARYTDKKGLTAGVYRWDTAGKKAETLVDDGRFSVYYVGFMGEDAVVAASGREKFGLKENPNLYLIRDGQMDLLCKPDENPGSLVGSDCRYGDGTRLKATEKYLYYTVASHTRTLLRRVSKTGAVQTVIDRQGSIDGFDVCDDTVLFYGMRDQKLQEVYSATNGTEIQQTFFNRPALAGKSLSVPQPLTVQNGDTPIEGFVMRPVGFDSAKKYPGILEIHGGPKGAFGDVFFHEIQVMANRGYFVFFCNPRGSEGRGNEFADIRGKYGTVDYDDLMRFTDAVLEKYPQIDRERLGVTGGSYGGYMTNWIIGHTDRFRCAVSQRSISNWLSKFGTTDIGYYFNTDQQASTPWDNPEKLWWHSPLKYADHAKTPTLFLHSDQDYRCWMGEGLQMFLALKYHGVDAKMCLFHGENHELSRSGKPQNRIARLREMLEWLDRYLQGTQTGQPGEKPEKPAAGLGQ